MRICNITSHQRTIGRVKYKMNLTTSNHSGNEFLNNNRIADMVKTIKKQNNNAAMNLPNSLLVQGVLRCRIKAKRAGTHDDIKKKLPTV